MVQLCSLAIRKLFAFIPMKEFIKKIKQFENSKKKTDEHSFLKNLCNEIVHYVLITIPANIILIFMSQIRFVLTIIFILLSGSIFSQTIRIPGYVVKNSGDTLRGWIDYSNWNKTPLYIGIRQDSLSKDIKYYSPTQIRYFELTGYQAFESFPVERHDLSVKEIHKEQINLYNRLITDTVFLEIIVKGYYFTFYKYDAIDDTYYFIRERENNPIQLDYCKFDDKGHVPTIGHNPFRFLLLEIAKRHNVNERLLDRIMNATIDDVAGIVSQMNKGKVSFSSKIFDASNIHSFIAAGFGYGYLRIPVGDLHAAYPGTIATIGIGADVMTSNYFRSLMIRGDFYYRKYSFNKINFDGMAYSFSFWYQNIIKRKIKVDVGIGFVSNVVRFTDATKVALGFQQYEFRSYWNVIDARVRLLYIRRFEVALSTTLWGQITHQRFDNNPNTTILTLGYHVKWKRN